MSSTSRKLNNYGTFVNKYINMQVTQCPQHLPCDNQPDWRKNGDLPSAWLVETSYQPVFVLYSLSADEVNGIWVDVLFVRSKLDQFEGRKASVCSPWADLQAMVYGFFYFSFPNPTSTSDSSAFRNTKTTGYLYNNMWHCGFTHDKWIFCRNRPVSAINPPPGWSYLQNFRDKLAG